MDIKIKLKFEENHWITNEIIKYNKLEWYFKKALLAEFRYKQKISYIKAMQITLEFNVYKDNKIFMEYWLRYFTF